MFLQENHTDSRRDPLGNGLVTSWCVEVTEVEDSSAPVVPAVPHRSPCSGVRTNLTIPLPQGHGDSTPTTVGLLPAWLAITCLAITTLILVNAFAFPLYGFSIALKHQAMDFEEERILRCLLLKSRYLGQRHVPPHRPNAKNVPHSQSHTWLACVAMAQMPLWSLRILLGVGRDWIGRA